MSALDIAVPPRLPVSPFQFVGQVLLVPAGCRRYRDTALLLLVRRIRLDISQWYGGAWVWLEGDELADEGYSLGQTPVRVHVSICAGDQAARHIGRRPAPRPPATG
ncbi:MAG: hypothetical protein QOH97_4465 [Actinoplanes sp.]|nr:hypothetical protein [Actinoplanes sp.]